MERHVRVSLPLSRPSPSQSGHLEQQRWQQPVTTLRHVGAALAAEDGVAASLLAETSAALAAPLVQAQPTEQVLARERQEAAADAATAAAEWERGQAAAAAAAELEGEQAAAATAAATAAAAAAAAVRGAAVKGAARGLKDRRGRQ